VIAMPHSPKRTSRPQDLNTQLQCQLHPVSNSLVQLPVLQGGNLPKLAPKMKLEEYDHLLHKLWYHEVIKDG
jgi:hypothetical protein